MDDQLRSPKISYKIYRKRSPYYGDGKMNAEKTYTSFSTQSYSKQCKQKNMDPEASWRENKVIRRNLYLLDSGLMADCTFVVGKFETKKFQCHKLILSQGSSVFYAMFNGDLKEIGEVKVEDIEPQPFQKMLEYIYSDNAELEDVETALSVCYAANKYMINTLILECIDFIKDNLDADSVCSTLEFARLIDNADLEEECLKYLRIWIRDVLKSKSFLSVERETLLTILDQDDLKIKSEVDLFSACIRWAQAHHSDEKVTLREVLGAEVMNRIRFLAMTAKEFVTYVVSSKLLRVQEERDILCFIAVGTGVVPQGFSTSRKHRANLKENRPTTEWEKRLSLLSQTV